MMSDQQLSMYSIDANKTITGECGFLTFKEIRTIEGWIQLDPKQGENDPVRLITFTFDEVEFIEEDSKKPAHFEKTTNNKTEFYIEFSKNEIQLGWSDGVLKDKAKAPIADGKPHYFSLTLPESVESFNLRIDAQEPIEFCSETKIPDLLINTVTIGHNRNIAGFNGGIYGLHFWNVELTADELSAISKWRGAHCPTPDFGFTSINPSKLAGFLNPDMFSFIFYKEPTGFWAMDGTETTNPKKTIKTIDYLEKINDLSDIYPPTRYFLITREDDKLYIINDVGVDSLCLIPDESNQLVFKNDDLVITYNLSYMYIDNKLIEHIQFDPAKGKAILPIFKGKEEHYQRCNRPDIKPPTKSQEQFESIFAHQAVNTDKSLNGWNIVDMDPFDTSQTYSENQIFEIKMGKYFQSINNLAIPFGLKFIQGGLSGGRRTSSLIANGVDLRNAASNSKSIEATASGGNPFFSASVSFKSNKKLSKTQENMYNNEQMHSQHTSFVVAHTLILDKSNIKLSNNGLNNFIEAIEEYARGGMSSEIFSSYGTHYPNAITYGARGRARNTYTKENMSSLLRKCKNVGWGIETSISVGNQDKSGGGKAGFKYSSEDEKEDTKTINATQNFEIASFECIGGEGCGQDGHPVNAKQNPFPIFMDLRPIWELLAPPFFDTYEMTVNVRKRLKEDFDNYLSHQTIENPEKEEDTFGFYSVAFSEPMRYFTSINIPNSTNSKEEPLLKSMNILSNASIKVTYTNDPTKNLPELRDLEITNIKTWQNNLIIPLWGLDTKQNGTKIQIEFIPPKLSTGDKNNLFQPITTGSNGLKLNFDLVPEQLSQQESKFFSVTGKYTKPTKLNLPGNHKTFPNLPFFIKFPVEIQKLNMKDAFFNGLPQEWR